MRAKLFGLVLAGTLMLGGCMADPADQDMQSAPEQAAQHTDIQDTGDNAVAPDLRPMGETKPRPDASACTAAGGSLERRGRAQTTMCVHPYSDAGESCTDNLQCEGKCIAPVDDGPDGAIVGQCQPDDALFGCYAEVVDSKLVRAICVD